MADFPCYSVTSGHHRTGYRSDKFHNDFRLLKKAGLILEEPRNDLPPLVVGDKPIPAGAGLSEPGLEYFEKLVNEVIEPRRLAAELQRIETRLISCGHKFRVVQRTISPAEKVEVSFHKAACRGYSEAEERLFLIKVLNLNEVFLCEQSSANRSIVGWTRTIERAASDWCFRPQLGDVEQSTGGVPDAPKIIKRLAWNQTPVALLEWFDGCSDQDLFELW